MHTPTPYQCCPADSFVKSRERQARGCSASASIVPESTFVLRRNINTTGPARGMPCQSRRNVRAEHWRGNAEVVWTFPQGTPLPRQSLLNSLRPDLRFNKDHCDQHRGHQLAFRGCRPLQMLPLRQIAWCFSTSPSTLSSAVSGCKRLVAGKARRVALAELQLFRSCISERISKEIPHVSCQSSCYKGLLRVL